MGNAIDVPALHFGLPAGVVDIQQNQIDLGMVFHHLLHSRSHGSAGLTPVRVELNHGGPAVSEGLLQG